MERERQSERPTPPAGSGPGPDGEDVLAQLRLEAEGLLDAADKILDSIKPVNAEDYLQQNRQRGGE
jgi:hypothetical protein